jgi:hypothetical protein
MAAKLGFVSTRYRSCLLGVLLAMLLAGCERPVVMPKTSALWEQHRTVDAGFPACYELDRTPLPSFRRRDGDTFSVGIYNWYFPGAEPVPCWRRHETRAIGLVRWDLRVAQSLLTSGYRLERAELVERFEYVVRRWGDYWEGTDLAVARVAAARWSAVDRRGDPSDPTMSVATVGEPVSNAPFSLPFSERTRDVTALVNRWLSGELPNHGLVYESVRFGIGENVTRSVEQSVRVDLQLYFSRP